MSKHTSGPWVTFTKGRYDLGSGIRNNWQIGISNRELKQDICLINCGNKDDNFETEKANARLIASAPELLEACKEAKRLYDHFSLSPLAAASKYGDNYEPPTDEEYLEMRKALEQAIAKVEGR